MSKRPKPLLVTYDEDDYIYIKSHAWLSHKLPSRCMGKDGLVWLVKYIDDLYVTCAGPDVIARIEGDRLIIVERPEPKPF